jgi:hypothetical protein
MLGEPAVVVEKAQQNRAVQGGTVGRIGILPTVTQRHKVPLHRVDASALCAFAFEPAVVIAVIDSRLLIFSVC